MRHKNSKLGFWSKFVQIHKNNQKYTFVHKFLKRPCTLLIPNPGTYWPWRGFLPLHLTQCSTPFPSGCVQYSLLPWWMCATPALAPLFARNTNIFTKLNNLHQYSTYIHEITPQSHKFKKAPPPYKSFFGIKGLFIYIYTHTHMNNKDIFV